MQAAAERAQTALKRADRTGGELLERSAREIASLANKQNVPGEFREVEAGLRAAAAADALRANAESETLAGDASPKLARALVQAAAALEAPPQGAASAAATSAHVAEVARLLKPVEGGAALEAARRKADGLAAQLNRQNGPSSPAQMAERKQLREEAQALPKQLREARRYVIVGAFVIAAVLTPPDVLSQFMLAVPLLLLYELGIFLSGFITARSRAPQEEEVVKTTDANRPTDVTKPNDAG